MNFFLAVLNFFSGGIVDKILDYFAERDDAKIAAMNDAEKRAFEERKDQRQTAKEIRLATADHWEMRLLTFLIAFPFVAHLMSIWMDTQFKLDWNIDKFPAPFDEWEGAILLSFFGVAVAGNAVKSFAQAKAYESIKKRKTLFG